MTYIMWWRESEDRDGETVRWLEEIGISWMRSNCGISSRWL